MRLLSTNGCIYTSKRHDDLASMPALGRIKHLGNNEHLLVKIVIGLGGAN